MRPGRIILAAFLLLSAGPSALGAVSWTLSTIDPDPNSGWTCSLAVGPSGLPSVAYWTIGGNVRLAWYDGSLWHLENVPRNDVSAAAAARPAGADGALLIRTMATGLALDPAGEPWVAHVLEDADHDYQGMLEVSHREDGTWATENLVIANTRPAIAVDPAGVVHVAFGSPSGLRYATRTESGWTSEIVDPASLMSASPSLALDGQGGAHIAYMGYSPQSIRYAEFVDGAWQRVVVDSTSGVVGPSLAMRDPDRPVIAYRRSVGAGDSRQRLARRTDGAWSSVETSSPTSSVYWESSLALGCSGQALIAYSGTGQTLWLATVDGGSWSFEQVATSASHVSLALTPAGMPLIAHASSTGLRLATGTMVAAVPPSPLPDRFRLIRCAPNPARRGAALELVLESPRAEELRFEVFDLAGRRLAASRPVPLAPGTSSPTWNAPLRAGLCWVRARTASGCESSTRVLVLP